MKKSKFKSHLIDSIMLLKEQAREAKKDEENPENKLKDYIQGLVMGYYSIVSLLKNQAFAFCMDQNELGLADINPDIDLLGLHTRADLNLEEDNWAVEVINEERAKGYLIDLISLIKKQAREAKNDAENPKAGFEDYNKGEVMAYCSVISLLKRQALVFNIDQNEIGLADTKSE